MSAPTILAFSSDPLCCSVVDLTSDDEASSEVEGSAPSATSPDLGAAPPPPAQPAALEWPKARPACRRLRAATSAAADPVVPGSARGEEAACEAPAAQVAAFRRPDAPRTRVVREAPPCVVQDW